MKYILELQDPFAEEPDDRRLDAVQHEDELKDELRHLLDRAWSGLGWQLHNVYRWEGGGKLVLMDLRLAEEHRDDGWLDRVYEVAAPGDEKPVRVTVSFDERI